MVAMSLYQGLEARVEPFEMVSADLWEMHKVAYQATSWLLWLRKN